MDKMIISVFDNEEKAFNGLTALKELHDNGDITIYSSAVINKNESGEVRIKEAEDEGPIGSAVGMFTGSLIGVLGGPIGLAIGGTAGLLGGMFYDLDTSDIDSDFVTDVSASLENGKTAVVIDADEEWTVPVNTKMEENGGLVFRKYQYETEIDQLNRETKALNAKFKELEIERIVAIGDQAHEDSLLVQLNENTDKRHAVKVAIDKKMDAVNAEESAKLNKINGQMEKAGKWRKERLQKRKDKAEANFKERKGDLTDASNKISEFLS